MDSLKEGIRVVLKTKVLKEWTKVRKLQMQYLKKNMQRYDPQMADSAYVEHEID